MKSNITKKYNNNIDQVHERHIDKKEINNHKRKITDNKNFQSTDEIIKKRKLITTDQFKNILKLTNKRKIDNNTNTTYPNKKIKYQEKDNNYNDIKQKQSHEKLIPISHMIILKNEERNKKTYKKIIKDHKLCARYGYKFKKICTVHMNDITQTLAILNAKIKTQTKDNREILLTKQVQQTKKF